MNSSVPVQVPEYRYLDTCTPQLHLYIAYLLQEPNIQLIERVVQVLGGHNAMLVLQKVKEIQGNGGILNQKATRYRTPGGVYFFIIKNELSPEWKTAIFSDLAKSQRKARKGNN